MKRYIFSISAILFTLAIHAQSVLSFGLRGGLDFMMPKSECAAKAKLGIAENFDLGYTYYWNTRNNGDWGIHTGVSIGYAQNRTFLEFTQQYTNYDYLHNEMLYTTSGTIDAKLRRFYVEIPLMAAFRHNGFVTQLGIKGQSAIWSRATQNLVSPMIDAYYVQYDVHVTNELVTGIVADQDLEKSDANIAPRLNLLLAARIGYEFKIGYSGSLGIMAYVDYNVWNTSSYQTGQRVIDVSPITNTASPVPNVLVNPAFSSLISRINPLQVGISICYSLNFEKY